MRGAYAPRSTNTKTMKNQNHILRKMRFMDYIFALFCVLLLFGFFPRDYQTNAPTIFALCTVFIFQISKSLAKSLRVYMLIRLYENNETTSKYILWNRYDLRPALCTVHVPAFIAFMILIA